MVTNKPEQISQEMKTNIIEVSSYENKDIRGKLFNACYKKGRTFGNLMQLLLLIDELQNSLHFPQKGMENRKFPKCNASDIIENEERENRTRKQNEKTIATFKVNILFRQNASWQGNIVWVEKDKKLQFRSVLELAMLMDSVLA